MKEDRRARRDGKEDYWDGEGEGEGLLLLFAEKRVKATGEDAELAIARSGDQCAYGGGAAAAWVEEKRGQRGKRKVMYENKAVLLCTAETSPVELFEKIVTVTDAQKISPRSSSRSQRYDDIDLCVDNELGFAKERTMSRLTEMNSKEYLEQHEVHRLGISVILFPTIFKGVFGIKSAQRSRFIKVHSLLIIPGLKSRHSIWLVP
ncbi:hypothetical protein ZIOFF_028980 [Zingiber officinale]|uniref:Uncharacterized protein n=1 Tax=Zingiber officinale TaxID=94328 RepID=A0A8J5GNV8_ZINOF|nr:hypothetical protein ZIOFF_028980 [Zingiber officinale]